MDELTSGDLPLPPSGGDDVPDWQPLPARAAHVQMLVGALYGLVITVPAFGVAVVLLRDSAWSPFWLALAAAPVLCGAGAVLGRLHARRCFWRLDAQGLQVKRGILWREEILVPRSRVQHLDIERGPLERRWALATLVVHTAGTRTHALRQSGLDDADAVALRDALVPQGSRHDDAL